MPVFNLALRFDNKGTLVAVDQLGKVSDAAGKAQRSTDGLVKSVSKFASTETVQKLAGQFEAVGISINTAGKHAQDLAVRMQRVSRENLFQQLGNDAKLSALQMARLRAGMGDIRGAFTSLSSAVTSSKLAVAAWGAALLYAGKSILDAQIELQRLEQSYKSVFGEGAAAQLQTVYEQADRVGLKYFETAEAAKSFFAAGQGTSLSPELDNIFKAVTNAGAALQLSTEQVNGTFIALGQMISKGKVQAEELRGQLGERLPGAFQMAAKAMGMTTAELDKFMADGKLTAEDLLPRLAEALQEKYAKAAEEAANTAQGSINRMSTEWTLFKANVLDSGPMVAMINAVTDALKGQNEEAARRKEIARIDAQLEARGERKSPQVDYDDGGEITVTYGYSEAQRENIRIEERQGAYLEKLETEEVAREEKASVRGKSALEKALTGTRSETEKAIHEEWKAGLAEIERLRDLYNSPTEGIRDEKQRKGKLAELDRQRAEINEKYETRLESLNKKRTSSTKSAAVAQADYTGELERTRQQIDSLQQQLGLDPTENLTKAKIKIEQQYQAEISKTKEELAQRVARGQLTPEQADTLRTEKTQAADLERQVALRDAVSKAEEKYNSNLQVRADFYKELSEKSGEYGLGLVYQNQLLQQQAKEWIAAGVPIRDVTKMLEMQRLEAARDPWSGMSRSVRKFYSDATNYAKGFEEVSTQAFDGFSSQLSRTLWKGEQDFAAFFDSIGQMLMDMAIKASMAQIIGNGTSGGGGLLGLLGGALGGLFGGNSFASSPGFSIGSSAISAGAFFASAQGNVFSGGNLSDYSNSIVTQPTFFGYDRHFSAFARGAGLMGEAGPEAILPLGRMRGGDLGIRVDGLNELMRQDREWDMRKHSAGYSEELRRLIAQAAEMRSQRLAAMPTINVTVINQAGAEVETNQRQNSDGSLELEILLTKMAQRNAQDMDRRGGYNNRVLTNSFNLSKRPIGR